MLLNANFELVDIAGEYMAVPIGNQAQSFSGIVALSEAAFFLLKKMKEPKTINELAELLTQEYDVELSVALADTKKLIRNLIEMGIVEDE